MAYADDTDGKNNHIFPIASPSLAPRCARWREEATTTREEFYPIRQDRRSSEYTSTTPVSSRLVHKNALVPEKATNTPISTNNLILRLIGA